jgi:type I restriction enzyme R subunit
MEHAKARGDGPAHDRANAELEALILFRADMGSFVRLYTYLSQIFDYGNTEIEKRSIFYRRLLPLLDFGRERDEIDLSRVVLTHHTLKSRGLQPMTLRSSGQRGLDPAIGVGTGRVQDRERVRLREVIQKVNDLFSGDLSEQDALVFVTSVVRGKLLESDTLVQQAGSNSKEQFANSPDLMPQLVNALIAAYDAHTSMSTQALNSETVRRGLLDILLNHAGLYESLREKGDVAEPLPDSLHLHTAPD